MIIPSISYELAPLHTVTLIGYMQLGYTLLHERDLLFRVDDGVKWGIKSLTLGTTGSILAETMTRLFPSLNWDIPKISFRIGCVMPVLLSPPWIFFTSPSRSIAAIMTTAISGLAVSFSSGAALATLPRFSLLSEQLISIVLQGARGKMMAMTSMMFFDEFRAILQREDNDLDLNARTIIPLVALAVAGYHATVIVGKLAAKTFRAFRSLLFPSHQSAILISQTDLPVSEISVVHIRRIYVKPIVENGNVDYEEDRPHNE